MSRPTPLIAALVLAAVLLPAVAQHTGTAQPGAAAQTSAAQTPLAQTPAVQTRPAVAPASSASLSLRVTNARVVAIPPGVTETSVFMTLRNTGGTPLVLTGVQSDVARHGMLMVTRRSAQGLTGMRDAATLTVPARGTLILSESGDHLMLMGLKRSLKVGETLRLRLLMRSGRALDVKAVVRKP